MSTDTAAVGGSERPAAMGNSGHTLTCAVRLSFGWAPGGCAWLPWGPESGRSRQVGDWGSNLWRRRRQGVLLAGGDRGWLALVSVRQRGHLLAPTQ